MTRVWIDTIARLVVFILLLILTFLWNKFSAISSPCDTTVLLLRGYGGVSKKLHPLPHRGGLKKIPGGYFWGSLLGNDAVFERAYRVGGSFSSCAPPSSFHVFLLSVIDGSQLCKFSQILYQNLCETGTCKANSTWQQTERRQ